MVAPDVLATFANVDLATAVMRFTTPGDDGKTWTISDFDWDSGDDTWDVSLTGTRPVTPAQVTDLQRYSFTVGGVYYAFADGNSVIDATMDTVTFTFSGIEADPVVDEGNETIVIFSPISLGAESAGSGVTSDTAGGGLAESAGVLSVNPGAGIEISGDKVAIDLDTRRATAAFTLDEANGLDLASGGVVRDRIANDAINEAKVDPALLTKINTPHAHERHPVHRSAVVLEPAEPERPVLLAYRFRPCGGFGRRALRWAWGMARLGGPYGYADQWIGQQPRVCQEQGKPVRQRSGSDDAGIRHLVQLRFDGGGCMGQHQQSERAGDQPGYALLLEHGPWATWSSAWSRTATTSSAL